MLTINLLHLINNKTLSIKYTFTSLNYKKKNYYIYNNFHNNLIDLIELLNSLSTIYLYLHKYITLKQKILLYTNNFQYMYLIKSMAFLTSNYYMFNNIEPGIFTNWIVFKKKLTLYKWLEYFFFIKLNLTSNYKNSSYIYHTLYILYLKLKLKYNGLKQLNILPKTLLCITLNTNKYLKELIHLNKNIIYISNKKYNKNFPINMLSIFTKNINYSTLHFILNIITTAILHGLLY